MGQAPRTASAMESLLPNHTVQLRLVRSQRLSSLACHRQPESSGCRQLTKDVPLSMSNSVLYFPQPVERSAGMCSQDWLAQGLMF